MENPRITNTPYDDVFRTLLNDCSPLIIPLINAVFGEQYSGEEKITFSPNEHFLNRQGGNEDERITDSSFKIHGRVTKKYHLECQSSPDNSLLVRFFEYGTQIALDEGEITANTLTVALPHSAVLFLRCGASTPDTLKIRIETPGGAVEYDIPAIKSQQYSLQEIFDKNLLLLIPFYIFSHEKRFGEYEKDSAKLRRLQEEYSLIKYRLEELAETAAISQYVKCTIIDMLYPRAKKFSRFLGARGHIRAITLADHCAREYRQSTGAYRSQVRCCQGRSESRYGRKDSGI